MCCGFLEVEICYFYMNPIHDNDPIIRGLLNYLIKKKNKNIIALTLHGVKEGADRQWHMQLQSNEFHISPFY